MAAAPTECEGSRHAPYRSCQNADFGGHSFIVSETHPPMSGYGRRGGVASASQLVADNISFAR